MRFVSACTGVTWRSVAFNDYFVYPASAIIAVCRSKTFITNVEKADRMFWRGGKAEDGIDENTLVTALHTARDLDDSLRAIVAESAPRYGDARPVASIPERNEVVFRGPEPIQPVAAQAAAPLTLESDSGHETNKYHQQRTRKLLYHLLADPRDWYKIRIVSR
uniref:Transposase n=1 Tax=Panagrellus redivivus TaxID=6233 RepID=A0A7E4W6L3_PANRE